MSSYECLKKSAEVMASATEDGLKRIAEGIAETMQESEDPSAWPHIRQHFDAAIAIGRFRFGPEFNV
jgi:hypothetical protein